MSKNREVPDCDYSLDCSGCSHRDSQMDEQTQLKESVVSESLRAQLTSDMIKSLPPWDYARPAPRGLDRWRLEFQIRGKRLGLPQKNNGAELVDIQKCQLALPSLNSWLKEVRKLLPELELASCRIRVSPQGLKGIWLDLPNEAARPLLADSRALKPLFEAADVVEIGQRRKPLYFNSKEDRFRLSKEHAFKTWTETQCNDQRIPLYSCIGDFSQPGQEGNQAITKLIEKYCEHSKSILEFGAGNGNLSLPALSFADKILCFERVDRLCQALEKSFLEARQIVPGLKNKSLTVFNRFLISQDKDRLETHHFAGIDTVLLNPSREGVGPILRTLLSPRVDRVVMMSCFPESFARDARILFESGFVLEEWCLVDQFQFTKHIEILSRWTRK